MSGPLNGVKVLDLSRILAGPWATQVLADYGAEVIKIERPGQGDDTRHWGPPFVEGADGARESAYFLCANRGKHSCELDITSEAGQQQIRRLVTQSDILVENYKVGGLAKYGLDYESLKALNPALIYCSITGFGQSGPDAERAGYDAMIQAMGGLMSLTGAPDSADSADGGPQKVGVAVADLMTGMYAVSAILAALHHRQQSGQGQHIDLALLDTQVAWLANQASNFLVSGDVPQRMGTAHPNIVPYQAFAAKDGHLLLAVGNDRQFAECCRIVGRPEWAEDPCFATNAARVENRQALVARLAERLKQQGMDYWLTGFADAAVPCGPINTLDRVFEEPQVKHRELQFSLPHASVGSVPQVGNPVVFSDTPIQYHRAPPVLGQDNALVQRRIAIDPESDAEDPV
ncbi:CaiB/BaiF CoA transferase family protein [Ferrimonas marina]|uniref:Crotonobetainyl-CoA:carnitine CoA-transferase CaiB n=1 Tax=Ferrimonas marina TaxID=299255 RepID=A0A1M5NEP1_9GAMM|nr:CoA transferase [Ferrimonas marina]SHG87981.1 Crotonobetainyl-CoA:carnitine CoA-transferase CaiB [Ferrimonas marina]